MPYDSVLIPNGYEARDIRTYYYDEKRQQWQALPLTCVNETESYVESRTTHFTDMINGLLKTPENPEGNIFVPTQIKDLKAADPTAGITRMKEPEANQRGSLSLSYPISLPQGRQGLTPAVTLSYGSTVPWRLGGPRMERQHLLHQHRHSLGSSPLRPRQGERELHSGRRGAVS